MTGDEIIEEMNKFTEILENTKWDALEACEELVEENNSNFSLFYEKQEVHKAAVECLNKILSPELKVFIRNLCLNRLGYPDEPVFYQAFGDYPKAGDKVSTVELEKRGINPEKFSNYFEIWNYESNHIVKKEIDGEKYFVIEELYDGSEDLSEENFDDMSYALTLRKILKSADDSKLTKKDLENKQKAIERLDSEIPTIGKLE